MSEAQQKYYDGKPGRYYCLCVNCDNIFYGDKRDRTCPRCEQLAAFVAQQPKTPEPRGLEAGEV